MFVVHDVVVVFLDLAIKAGKLELEGDLHLWVPNLVREKLGRRRVWIVGQVVGGTLCDDFNCYHWLLCYCY